MASQKQDVNCSALNLVIIFYLVDLSWDFGQAVIYGIQNDSLNIFLDDILLCGIYFKLSTVQSWCIKLHCYLAFIYGSLFLQRCVFHFDTFADVLFDNKCYPRNALDS